jgi:Arc/MetJ family transcription regulator
MRTNINIDDALMAEVLERTGLPTKKAAVEEGLRLLIQMAKQKAVLDLRGKIRWVGDLDAMREGRPHDDSKPDAWAANDEDEDEDDKA